MMGEEGGGGRMRQREGGGEGLGKEEVCRRESGTRNKF